MSYAFIHATVLDGTEKMKPTPDTTVLVDDEGKIVEVGPTAKVKMRGGEQIVDLQGKYLIPGLINMHVHLVGDGTPRSSSNAEGAVQKVTGNPVGMAILRHMLKASLKNQLASGVTTVRSVGDPGYADPSARPNQIGQIPRSAPYRVGLRHHRSRRPCALVREKSNDP